MLKPAKKLTVFALILLASALLLTANAGVKAASTTSVYVYTTFGGTISGNGTALNGGSTYTYNTGDTVNFTATASSGFKFLCYDYVALPGPATTTSNPFLQTLSTASCAIEALFIPTTNTTATVSGSGTATISTLLTAGGNTNPAVPASQSAGTYTNYTVGTTYPFQTVVGSDFKFLYWLVATIVGSTTTYNIYTSANPNIEIASSSVAIQAFFVASNSSVTVPTIVNEFSNASVALLAVVLVAVALGTYAYKRKAKR